MKRKQLQGRDEALRLVEQAMSPRACEIAELERWYDGTQYDDRPDWFTAVDKPLFERGPCIVYPFARSAISSHVDLVLGEGRFPALSVGSLDADSPFADEDSGDEDDRSAATSFLAEALKQARFEPVARQALTAAMATRSACMLLGARGGKLFCDLIKSRWCEPELDADGAVTRLVVEYPFTQAEQDTDGSWHLRAYLFRRVVDAGRDVTYKPARLQRGKRADAINWTEDPDRTIDHGLGFCPVVWYPFDRGCDVEGRIDGKALHDNLLDEIYAHDFTLSLRHRAAMYVEPQWVETGVDAGYNPSNAGSLPRGVHATPHGGDYTSAQGDNPIRGRYQLDDGPTGTARIKSPDTVWQYPKDGDAKLLSLPAGGLDALTEHARDLRIKLAEAAAVVFLDPGDIKYAASLSGKALETLRGRQLSRCDQIRSDVEDGLILPAARLILRIVATLGDSLRIPGLAKALPLLAKFSEHTDDQVPELRATWPAYFDVDHKDIEAVAGTVRQDLDAGIIRLETAVRKMADWYDIDDVESYVDELNSEREQKAAELHRAMAAITGDDDEGTQGPDQERGGAASEPARGRQAGARGKGRGGSRDDSGVAGNASPTEKR